ncbi:Short C-terminal domain-containing protein [Flavobacteriaceae bacterium MAR_2010_188]|nr:Short C-terminal domain-containing protein [Flavobacteriaceae bacterium MAR_2010_188]
MDKIEELKKLKDLLDNGFISKEEFNSLKAEILSIAKPAAQEVEEIEKDEVVVPPSNPKNDSALQPEMPTPENLEKEADVSLNSDFISIEDMEEEFSKDEIFSKEDVKKEDVKREDVKEEEVKKEDKIYEIKLKCKKCNKEISKYIEQSNKGLCIDCKEKSLQIPKLTYLFLLLLIPLIWWVFKDSSSEDNPRIVNPSQSVIDRSGDGSSNNYDTENVVLKTFFNPVRFYKIDYPDNLKQGKPSWNNDGISFKSDNGKENLSVYSSILRYPTLKEKYNSEIKEQDYEVTYKVFKGDWYAISGYIKNTNDIFYLKCYLSKEQDETRTLILTYPESKKNIYNSILSKILDSFTDTEIKNAELQETYESSTIPINSHYVDLKLIAVSCYEGNECKFEFQNSDSKTLFFDWYLEPTNAEKDSYESVFMTNYGTGYNGFNKYYGKKFRVYYNNNDNSPGTCKDDDDIGLICTKILNMYLIDRLNSSVTDLIHPKSGTINGTDVIIRQKPNSSSKILGSFKKSGEQITIIDEYVSQNTSQALLSEDIDISDGNTNKMLHKGKALNILSNEDSLYLISVEDDQKDYKLKVTPNYIEFVEDKWFRIIRTSGETGWVLGKFISVEKTND